MLILLRICPIEFDMQIRIATLLIFIAANVAFLLLTYVWSPRGIAYCCDARLYIKTATAIFENGILFDHRYDGYRSVYNYLLAGTISWIGFGSYPAGALCVFIIEGTTLTLILGERKGFLPVFGAFFLNPITAAFVPIPLQESQMVIVLGPLAVMSYVALRKGDARCATPCLLAFAACAWMTKGSLLLVAAPVAALAVWMAFRDRIPIVSAVGGAMIAVIVVLPQVYIAWHKFGTLFPYPAVSILEKQMVWGYRSWRYETDMTGEKPRGVFFPTPFVPIKDKTEYLDRLRSSPGEVVALWIGHVVAAFDYSHLKTYVTEKRSPFSVFNVVVGTVIFLGVAQWSLALRIYDRADVFLDSVLIGSVAVLPFLAVETRFSLLAMTVLSCRTCELLGRGRQTAGFPTILVMSLLGGFIFATAALFLASIT
jgi:hypothetical protein